MNTTELQKVFRKAADTAVVEWFNGQWHVHEEEIKDLTQELWVWYLESPETQRKMAGLSFPEAVKTARLRASQLLSKQTLDSNTFNGKSLFSSDAVKDALKGKSNNKYLKEVLPLALQDLDNSDSKYAEALRKRYQDNQIPEGKAQENLLVRAHKALTDEINVNYITAEVDGIGSKTVAFPSTRRANGNHSETTADITMLLIEDPEVRADYLEETPLNEVLAGEQTYPVFDLGGGVKIRPTGEEAAILRQHPELLDLYLETTRALLVEDAEDKSRDRKPRQKSRPESFMADKDREYRRALGVPDGQPLPKRLGQC